MTDFGIVSVVLPEALPAARLERALLSFEERLLPESSSEDTLNFVTTALLVSRSL